MFSFFNWDIVTLLVIRNTGRNCGFNIEGLKSAITVQSLVPFSLSGRPRPYFAPILNTPDGYVVRGCLPDGQCSPGAVGYFPYF